METPEEPAKVTVIDGVLSEPINVLVEVAVTVASGEENDGEDDVHEDKELESVVEGDKDGDEEDDDDENWELWNLSPPKQSKQRVNKCGSLSMVSPPIVKEGQKESKRK
uniref:Uncharacterized protein n=1 Tax=Brassica campestris TaxID=3711 RepID=M4DF58_BRACM